MNATARNNDGTFAKGASGNPKGRPRREHEARYQAVVYSALTEDALFRAVSKLIELAEQGDVSAIRELLRLALPATRDPFEEVPDLGDDPPQP